MNVFDLNKNLQYVEKSLEQARMNLLKATLSPISFDEEGIKMAMKKVYDWEKSYNDFLHTEVTLGKVKY